jgi:hypothetical protein
MKKKYFLAIFLAFGMVNANAQFALDDMESYGGDNAPIFEAQWGSWNGLPGQAMSSTDAQAQSGALSGSIHDSNQDALLFLGNKTFGLWGVKFSMYVPSGKTGYFNLQGSETPNVQNVIGGIFFGLGHPDDDEMTGRMNWYTFSDPTDDTLFQFPKDQWFDIIMNFDFNSNASAPTWTLWVDNVEVVAPGTAYASKNTPLVYAQAVGAIDFWANFTTTEMYIDDVEYINDFYPDPTLGVDDLNAVGFTSYPNPVKNVLNVQANEEITSAVVYNFLGQEVYDVTINALSGTIDMSRFAGGAYFVKVNVGETVGIVKIFKYD